MSNSLYDRYAARYPGLLANLENARRRGRLAHAYLLHADTERARREFSVVLSQLAACPESRNGRPCTACRVCRQLEAGNYPEFHTLSPIGKMYQIQVGDRTNPEPNTLRFFEEQFFLTSTGGANRKIGVIYDADRMGDEAQNALLKTLEEPPPETLLILASGNPAALLPTTRSRCQGLLLLENHCEFDFPGLNEVIGTLNTLCFGARGDLVAAEEGAAVLVKVASALNADAAARVAEEWKPKVVAAAQNDPAMAKRIELQQQAAANGAYRKERGQFLAVIHTFCAQLFLLASGASGETLANPELLAGVSLPESFDEKRAAAVLQEAEDLLYTLRFNVNEELALRTFAANLALK